MGAKERKWIIYEVLLILTIVVIVNENSQLGKPYSVHRTPLHPNSSFEIYSCHLFGPTLLMPSPWPSPCNRTGARYERDCSLLPEDGHSKRGCGKTEHPPGLCPGRQGTAPPDFTRRFIFKAAEAVWQAISQDCVSFPADECCAVLAAVRRHQHHIDQGMNSLVESHLRVVLAKAERSERPRKPHRGVCH